MLKSPIRICVRRLQTTARNAGSSPRYRLGATTASLAFTTAALVYLGTQRVIRNDAEAAPTKPIDAKESRNTVQPTNTTSVDPNELQTLIWGSNRSNVLSSGIDSEQLRLPQSAEWLNNVALRDLAFHKTYGACIDARGDVYQWGEGFSAKNTKPSRTLAGKDIVQIQLSESHLYALSSSGIIYVLAASEADQARSAVPRNSWMSTLGFGEKFSNYVEVQPNRPFSWGEKFISISAGDHHLLALTSTGKAFAHPITKEANAHGQLGLRKLQLPSHQGESPVTVELVPKSFSDPFARTTPFIRESKGGDQQNSPADIASGVFCPNIFEIPSLNDIKLSQLVAGSRTSFALTELGRVLGWGANEFGQIGLGGNIRMDAITVPTEVALWKFTKSPSKCLKITAGGDLTCYTVARLPETSPTTVDVLMCGNGQWGGLGNNTFSNAQGTPVKARSVSELTEYNDKTRSLQAIPPRSISVSPTGHVLLSLESLGGERDLLVWGKNYDSELGNGKKSSTAVPVVMYNAEGERVMLQRTKAKEVWDLQGKRWKGNVLVEQQPVTGYCNSAVFWKIVQ